MRASSWSDMEDKIMGEANVQSPRGGIIAKIFSMIMKSPKIMRRVLLERVTE